MAQLIIRGKVEALKTGTSQDGRDYASVQFLLSDGFGGLQVAAVFLPANFDKARFVAGKEIEVPVRASVNKQGRLSLRLDDSAEASKHIRAVS